MNELHDEFISGNTQSKIPLLEFQFSFILPRPNKERIIAERDQWGRIIRSEVPEQPLLNSR